MNKRVLAPMLLIMAIPLTAMAGVNVNVNIGLPPPIVFAEPPHVVHIPYAVGVYAVPDIDAEIFFWNGWWWRPWQNRWYRSKYYDRGWVHYSRVPAFYYDVDPGWRGYYREHRWGDGRWEYERIPYYRLDKNWKTWHNREYWQRQDRWNVEQYRPRTDRERKQYRDERKRYEDRDRDDRRRDDRGRDRGRDDRGRDRGRHGR